MELPPQTIIGAGTSIAAAFLLKHEHDQGQAAERLAAAALETLLNAIDANDPETGAHVRRVAAYALVLADALEVDDDERRLVEQVALFHDIGKIHEALFDIVREGRKLTPAERREIVTHPQKGADVLAPLCAFYPELPTGVLAHHEQWNGRGYPKGLKGHNIPLCARIVTIADTFDAITYRRRYHEGKPPRVALELILEKRGTQFDPQLVDLFSFPPVFERILETEKEVSRWPAGKPRPAGDEETDVPEITFRWRPAHGARRGRPQQGRGKRTAH
jgi:putative nucleotidyltransferase with HDIG domain